MKVAAWAFLEQGGWVAEADIQACCNHAALVFEDDGTPRVYTNSIDAMPATDGSLQLWRNGAHEEVLHITDSRDAYIRTLGVTRARDKYFAILYSGAYYGTQGGYSPSWAESDDGKAWTWRGNVSIYGDFQSQAMALIEQDGAFYAWTDGTGMKLRQMTSGDGINWKDQGSVWPAGLAGQALYVSAAYTGKGTMLSFADAFPATRITTLWKCNGGEFALQELDAPIRNGSKGTALAFFEGRIHAYANGRHWSIKEPLCADRTNEDIKSHSDRRNTNSVARPVQAIRGVEPDQAMGRDPQAQ